MKKMASSLSPASLSSPRKIGSFSHTPQGHKIVEDKNEEQDDEVQQEETVIENWEGKARPDSKYSHVFSFGGEVSKMEVKKEEERIGMDVY